MGPASRRASSASNAAVASVTKIPWRIRLLRPRCVMLGKQSDVTSISASGRFRSAGRFTAPNLSPFRGARDYSDDIS